MIAGLLRELLKFVVSSFDREPFVGAGMALAFVVFGWISMVLVKWLDVKRVRIGSYACRDPFEGIETV